jgi:heme/copper-type cytochrome/quinol oxidase subunit 3
MTALRAEAREAAPRLAPLPVGGKESRSPGRWGMIWTVATEASFFAYLIFSYFYLASMARGAWPPDGMPELRLALPNTVILLLSSASMVWAERSIKRGNPGSLRAGLVVSFVLGGIFLAIQGIEYSHKHFSPQSDAYGSLFYTITGFHGAHVAVGLLMIAVVTIRAFLGHFRPGRHLAVSNVALYWHFVDAVWLVVFTTIYLSPRLA